MEGIKNNFSLLASIDKTLTGLWFGSPAFKRGWEIICLQINRQGMPSSPKDLGTLENIFLS